MRSLTLTLILGASILRGQDAGEAAPNYSFAPAAAMNEVRQPACLAGLGDGRAVAAGGATAEGPVATVEMYSAETGWTRVASMQIARTDHTCTVLADGRVLVAGGRNSSGPVGVVEIYDPAADDWQRLPQGMIARWDHTATLLSDGRVLLAGGQNETRFFDTLEIVDPWFGTLTLLNARLRAVRTGHAAAALPGGAALVTGGFNTVGFLNTTDIVTAAGRVEEGPALADGAADLSATVLPDARILIAGGRGASGDSAAAYVFTPGVNGLRAAAPLPAARYGHGAVLLDGNGRVLIAGGVSAEQALVSSLLYDPVSGQWETAGDLASPAGAGAFAVLKPGAVLALAETPQTMFFPAIRLDRTFYTANDPVRVSFANFGAGEAAVTAATDQTPPVSVERTVPAGAEPADLFQVFRETAGRRWLVTALGGADGKALRASFLQKAKVRLTINPSPGQPLSYEPTTFTFSLDREGDRPGMTWPPSLLLRVTGKDEGNAAASFSVEMAGDQQGPVRGLAGGNYSVAARLNTLTEFYHLDGIIYRTDLTVGRRTPQSLAVTLPGGTTIVGELRPVTATVRTGLSTSFPNPSGTVTVARGGFPRGEIVLRAGGTGSGTANMALGQAGSYPVEFSYSGDINYLPVSASSPAFTIQKGNLTLTLKPVKAEFAVGETAWIDAVLTHPKVAGAIPTGIVEPMTVPQGMTAQGGTVGPDPNNTGNITVRVNAGTLLFAKSNNALTFRYPGDANFNLRTASTTVSFDRTAPVVTLKGPTTASTGQIIVYEVTAKAAEPMPGVPPPSGVVQLLQTGLFIRGTTMIDGLAQIEVGPFPAPGTYEYTILFRGNTVYTEYTTPAFKIKVE